MRKEEIPALLEKMKAEMREIELASRRLGEPFALQDVEFGALDAKLPQRETVFVDFEMLFGADNDIAEAQQRLADLGLSHLLDHEFLGRLALPEIEEMVAAAVGVTRCSARSSYGGPANLAWFLCAFALAYDRAFATHWSDGKHRDAALVQLGRLLEWWRWRLLGLDRLAKALRKSTKVLADDTSGGGAAAKAVRKAKASAWHRTARDKAAAIWKRNPRLTAAAVARDVHRVLVREDVVSADGEAPPREDTVRKVISPLKPPPT